MSLPVPKPSVLADEDCSICHEPLVLPNDDDPLSPSFVIDDVKLHCGHHFHQSCIVEYAISSPDARQRCALCRASVVDNNGNFMVTTRTENGYAGMIDLGGRIDEYEYFKAHPDRERAQIFLSLMSQMEFEEAEKFLKGEDGMGEEIVDPNVMYEFGGQTAMHMAALNNDVEGLRLLLRYAADKELEDDDGNTALDLAKEVKAVDAMALLA